MSAVLVLLAAVLLAVALTGEGTGLLLTSMATVGLGLLALALGVWRHARNRL